MEVKEIPVRVKHPESTGKNERYHRSVGEEILDDTEVEDFYRARKLQAELVRYHTRNGYALLRNVCAELITPRVARSHY